MKKLSISIFVGVLAAVFAANAPAQMISTQYAKKLILADASSSLVPLTLKAPAALTGAYSLTFPSSTPIANGYLLSANTSGVLSWVDPASYNFLTGVSHNATLTGDGTSGSPLAIDLSNNNTWTGVQTLPVTSTQGNALVASVNAASNTVNAASVGIGLTDAQVNNDLTINGGSITSSPISSSAITNSTISNSPINNSSIGATTAASGRFTDLTITSGFSTDGVVHNNTSGQLSSSLITNADVASNAGIIDTKLATIGTVGKVANSATTATSANTASAIVTRDVSGNFAAGTITAALSGNATTATTLQTARSIYGNSFTGAADLTQVIASTYGGTGNGFTKFTGPTTSEKTFTLPDASSTLVTTATLDNNTLDASVSTLEVGGGGATITKILSASATIDFANTNAGQTDDKNITVTGAADGDPVFLSVPNGSQAARAMFMAWVSAANTVTVRFLSNASNTNPASGTFRVVVYHF